MNISLSDDLKQFVDEQVAAKSYSSTSEYLRQLIRDHREIVRFRQLIDEGASSPIVGEFNEAYFDTLKGKIRNGQVE